MISVCLAVQFSILSVNPLLGGFPKSLSITWTPAQPQHAHRPTNRLADDGGGGGEERGRLAGSPKDSCCHYPQAEI